MTEPNNFPVPDASPEALWPDAAKPTGDVLVDRALGLLEAVPGSPVAEHGELYSGIHVLLLEALDAEPGLPPTSNRPSDSGPEGDS
ncbi:hypothetical protein ACFRJ9_16160 [Paenarthrobacter sp. NPDC056912]|uniref:hypothetical protein n=1 Tax=Paenarthrobacter sp. NPDC056912 TaxID=3345965 RepID=UPI0036711097